MKTEIILLGFLVLVSGCIDNSQSEPINPANSNQTSTPIELSDNSSSNTVYLTESGFQPSELTINQGETVTWINNVSNSMWVASDQHPSHTNYAGSTIYQHCQGGDQNEPAFDQCSSGEQFSFTFEKTGEWHYHNHMKSVQDGTIVVE
mgnify:FL=1